jgi:hypothetical protein
VNISNKNPVPSYCVFSNFLVNDKENYLRAIDSFNSFSSLGAREWVLNIRGAYKSRLGRFLSEKLGDKLKLTHLESRSGWIHDTQTLVTQVRTEYLIYWIEDHLSLVDPRVYDEVIKEMSEFKCHHLLHSFYEFGEYHNAMFNGIQIVDHNTIRSSTITRSANRERARQTEIEGASEYSLVSLAGIFEKNFFKRCLSYRWIRTATKYCPHNFEIDKYGEWVLPVKYGIPKFELFASIDDTRGREGYSLIDRGMYEQRGESKQKLTIEGHRTRSKFCSLRKLFHYNRFSYLTKFLKVVRGLKYFFQ